jgi:formate/nitrite transporter FocA (FNT family)
LRILSDLTMNDRTYVEKAAHAGAGKVSLLQLDPSRYLLRSVGAGMELTTVCFVSWALTQNLNDISLGRVIAAGFFGVALTIIVFTKYRAVHQRARRVHDVVELRVGHIHARARR